MGVWSPSEGLEQPFNMAAMTVFTSKCLSEGNISCTPIVLVSHFDWQMQTTATCWCGELHAVWPLAVVFVVFKQNIFGADSGDMIHRCALFIASSSFMLDWCVWALNMYKRTTEESLKIDTFNTSISSVTDNVELCSVVKPCGIEVWRVNANSSWRKPSVRMNVNQCSFTYTCFWDRMMWRLRLRDQSAGKRPCSFLRHNKIGRP